MGLSLTHIWRYPVKSCRGEPLTEAIVEPWGLAGDRRWMVVDVKGEPVTARDFPRLVLVTPRLGSGGVTLTSPGLPDLGVPVPSAAHLVPVNVWGDDLLATQACDEAAAWLTEVTGEPVRLVYLDDPERRPTDPDYSRDGDRVSFADNYPLLLVTQESLAQVNEWIAAGRRAAEGPVPVTRFRPSVVVSGAAAFAEDDWRRLRIGTVTFRVARGCDRCVFTTIDPDTAAVGHEPLGTLARHRRWDSKVWFGANLIPDTPRHGGVISVGDAVEILD